MRRLLLLLALLLAAFAASGGVARAQEAPLAVVALVTEQDDAGRWRAVDPSSAAVRTRGADEAPLSPGMGLEVGDTVTAGLARVELRYETGERIHLTDGAAVTLTAERSLLQQVGEVYYRLRGAFRVEYGTVETVVEGTRFVVVGEGTPEGSAVRVRVDEGRVRVSNDTESIPLPRGQQVVLPQVGAPAAPPSRARPSPAAVARTFPYGRPRAVFGALLTGGALVGVGETDPDLPPVRGTVGVRLSAGLSLGRILRATYDTTVAGAGRSGLRLPQELSLGVALPGTGVAFGGGPAATYEQRRRPCGARYRAIHVGGSGWVKASLPLARNLALVGELRAGYTDTLRASGAAGVEVAL